MDIQPITLEPLRLEIEGAQLARLFTALAKEPALFEKIQEVLEFLSLAEASPPGWARAAKAVGELPIEDLPSMPLLPPGGESHGLIASVEKECRRYLAGKFLVGEFRRRLGGKGALDPRILDEAKELIGVLLSGGEFNPKARFIPSTAEWSEKGVVLADLGLEISSESLSRFFRKRAKHNENDEYEDNGKDLVSGPAYGALFVCTIGKGAENLSRRAFDNGQPLEGVLFDALGSTLAEGAARALCRDGKLAEALSSKNEKNVIRRYAIGYGDWKLQGQVDLFRLLKPEEIDMELTTNFFMVPEKSVAGLAAVKTKAP